MSGNMRKCLNTMQHLEINGNKNLKSAVFNVKDDNNETKMSLSYCNNNNKLAFTKSDNPESFDDQLMTIDRSDGLVTVYNDLSVLNNANLGGNLSVEENLNVKGKLEINGTLSMPDCPSEAFQGSMLKTGLECGVLVDSVKFVNYLCEGFLEIELTRDLPECYRDCRDMVMFDYFTGPNAHLINGKGFILRFKESCGTCEDNEVDVNRKVIFVPTRELCGVRSGIEVPAKDECDSSQAAVYRIRSLDEYTAKNENAGLSFFFVDEGHSNDDESRDGDFMNRADLGNNNTNLNDRFGNNGGIFGNKSNSSLQERALVYDTKEDCWLFKGKVKLDPTKELQVNRITNRTDGFDAKGPVNIDGPTKISEDLDVEGDINLDGNINGNGETLTVGLSDGKSYLSVSNDNMVLKADGELTIDAEDDVSLKANNLDLTNLRGDIKFNEDTFLMFGGSNEPSAYLSNQNLTLSLVDCSESTGNEDDEEYGLKFISKNKDIVLHPRSEDTGEENGSVVIKGDLQVVNFFAHGMLSHSDAILKKDINDMEETAVEKLMKLRPVSYKWKDNSKQDMGFVAQQVEEQFPEFVATDPNGIKAVDYSKIVSVLTKGLQMQQDKINTLLETVADLKASRQ